jgi:hypothetical protein
LHVEIEWSEVTGRRCSRGWACCGPSGGVFEREERVCTEDMAEGKRRARGGAKEGSLGRYMAFSVPKADLFQEACQKITVGATVATRLGLTANVA